MCIFPWRSRRDECNRTKPLTIVTYHFCLRTKEVIFGRFFFIHLWFQILFQFHYIVAFISWHLEVVVYNTRLNIYAHTHIHTLIYTGRTRNKTFWPWLHSPERNQSAVRGYIYMREERVDYRHEEKYYTEKQNIKCLIKRWPYFFVIAKWRQLISFRMRWLICK